ncbi:MAG: hypothetical protein JRH15_16110 [Deltaproteobacteria bacterium]|nr:hypothetical protein [Deltaproteobacteria bacterium]
MVKKSAVNPSKYKRLFPYKNNYMEIKSHLLHYVDEGAGDPVVMVHGNPTWSFYYRSLIKALSAN